ncbi:MAG: LysR family transcriptional regulator [Stappiaceae bacterium]
MNLRDLEYVHALGNYQSFSKAAVACNVSQPALSNQVKKLEQELGAELFDRRLQEIRPTELGNRVIASAKLLLEEAQKIRDMATEYRNPTALPLRVGMVPTLAPFLMRYLFEQIQAVLPDIKLVVSEASSTELTKRVGNRDVDIALIPRNLYDGQMDFSPLFTERMFLATQSGHWLSKYKTIALDEIPYRKLICPNDSLGFEAEQQVQRTNPGTGNDVCLDVSGAGLETVCRHICVSDDCTIIPALASERFQREGWNLAFIPIDDPDCVREIGVISRVGCPRKPLLAKIQKQITICPPSCVQLV